MWNSRLIRGVRSEVGRHQNFRCTPIVELIGLHEAESGWQLQQVCVEALVQAFPTLQIPLSCLLDPSHSH